MRGCAVVLVLAACGSRASDPDPDPDRPPAPEALLARIPAGAAGVIGIDRARIHVSLGATLDVPGGRIAVRDVHGGSFAALRPPEALRRAAAALIPELGSVQWISGTLDEGRVLEATAMFPDARTAAAVAVSIGMARGLAATQLPAPIATAFDKIAFTAWGPAIRVFAVWTEADVAALLSPAAAR